MNLKQQYFNLLDEEYNKLPRDMGTKAKLSMENNPHIFLHLEKKKVLIAGLTLIIIHKNVFCIHNVIVDKKYRNEGMATKLIKDVHKKFKGIFILRTTTAKSLYHRLGYKSVDNKIMVFVNNKEMLRRNY